MSSIGENRDCSACSNSNRDLAVLKRKTNAKLSDSENVTKKDRINDDILLISKTVNFQKLNDCGLNVDYAVIFDDITAKQIYKYLEENIDYDTKSQVKLFGKLHDLPRKQTAYGDPGTKYTFSGISVTAKKWTATLLDLKCSVERLCRCRYNFVLVNRYDNGNDYIGEHRDDEKDLDIECPIASLSFGQHRDFIFKHKSSRVKKLLDQSYRVPVKKMTLENGSLLIMHYPTNKDWYHSLPKRSLKTCPNPRINLTFRKMKETNA